MKLFSADAEITFENDDIRFGISVRFRADSLVEAIAMAEEFIRDVIDKQYTPEIFRVEELEEIEEEDGD